MQSVAEMTTPPKGSNKKLIDGWLRDDQQDNDPAGPMKQAVIAQELIEEGLQFLAPNFERINVVCKDGNWARTWFP